MSNLYNEYILEVKIFQICGVLKHSDFKDHGSQWNLEHTE